MKKYDCIQVHEACIPLATQERNEYTSLEVCQFLYALLPSETVSLYLWAKASHTHQSFVRSVYRT